MATPKKVETNIKFYSNSDVCIFSGICIISYINIYIYTVHIIYQKDGPCTNDFLNLKNGMAVGSWVFGTTLGDSLGALRGDMSVWTKDKHDYFEVNTIKYQ